MPASIPAQASSDGKHRREIITNSTSVQTAITDMATIDELKMEAPIPTPTPAPASPEKQNPSTPEKVQPPRKTRGFGLWIGLGVVVIALMSVLIGWLAIGGGATNIIASPLRNVSSISSAVVSPITLPTQTKLLSAIPQTQQQVTRSLIGTAIVVVSPSPTVVKLTNTPLPTRGPTWTPAPSATPFDPVTNATVTFHEPFDQSLTSGKWQAGSGCEILGGICSITGHLAWGVSRLETLSRMKENQGLLAHYKFSDDAEFGIGLESGIFGTAGYRAIMVGYNKTYAEGGYALKEGKSAPYYTISEYSPNTWYSVLVKNGKGGQINIYLWERDQPQKLIAQVEKAMGNNWADLSWRFTVDVYSGSVKLDDYQELDFGQ
jgi:hypothetical protein